VAEVSGHGVHAGSPPMRFNAVRIRVRRPRPRSRAMRAHPAAPLRLQRSLGAATVMAVHRGGQHVLGVREVGMR